MRDNPPAESTTAAALTVAAVPTSLAIVVHAALAAGMTVAASARIRAKVFIDSIGGVLRDTVGFSITDSWSQIYRQSQSQIRVPQRSSTPLQPSPAIRRWLQPPIH